MLRTIAAVLIAASMVQPASAEDLVRGGVSLMPECPGDMTTVGEKREAAFLLSLIAPVIAGSVSNLVKKAGSRLTEAAQEQSVDRLHQGGYFYQWSSDTKSADRKFLMNFGCVVVVTRGERNAKRSLTDMVTDYQALNTMTLDGGASVRAPIEARDSLLNAVSDILGRDEESADEEKLPNPAVIAVFDVELSQQGTSFRLLPRFVKLDHSLRESKNRDKARSFTFEYQFSTPGAEKTFASSITKVDNLSSSISFNQTRVIGEYDVRKGDNFRGQATQWMPLPAIDESVKTKLASVSTVKGEMKTLMDAARTARSNANAYYLVSGNRIQAVKDVLDIIPAGMSSFDDCPLQSDIPRIVDETIRRPLIAEQSRGDAADKTVVAALTQSLDLLETCMSIRGKNVAINALTPSAGDQARSFDLEVQVKEYRKRPVARFFGEVLSDAEVQKGLSSAINAGINPAVINETEEAEEMEEDAARVAYETALLTVQKHEVELNALTPSTKDYQLKAIELKAAKTAANRAAKSLGRGLPYPAEGLYAL